MSEKTTPDLLAAYDAAVEALVSSPSDLRLKHQAVLTLARAGATQHARREYLRFGLDSVVDDEDVLALGGRILKDLSLTARGDAKRKLAALSAAKYLQAYALNRGHYPGVNTATMFLLAGDVAKSKDIAAAILEKVKHPKAATPEEAYYLSATVAEAHLLLGQANVADRTLAEAIAHDPRNFAARATTLRQLGLICAAQRIDSEWLEAHRPPPALFFSGHMFAATDSPDEAKALTTALHAALDKISPSAGFGALAAGTDLIMAEALLARGIALHVILPFLEDEFIAQSVAPFGASWVQRYKSVRTQAASFRLATHETHYSDDSVFVHGAEYAMGLALHHAERFATHAVHLAAWDGAPARGDAGAAVDVARWAALGHRQVIVPCPQALRPPPSTPRTAVKTPARSTKAILFGDIRGFSKLDERYISSFVSHVMQPLAETVHAQSAAPDLVATWGDGFHLVYDSVEAAAEAALAAQERFAALDLSAVGLPPYLALRVGGHVGPVAQITDPFLNAASFYGTQITVAARIEPVTVPGTVYVSEPFAALLALRSASRFRTDYAGNLELAKQFGTMRLFALRRVAPENYS